VKAGDQQAIAAHTAPMEKIERDFATFGTTRRELAPD